MMNKKGTVMTQRYPKDPTRSLEDSLEMKVFEMKPSKPPTK
jgi:hypothetical protein